MLAHRKQPPELTLVISLLPDPALDKARRRRSSRTAGLGSAKESKPSTLWFRAGPATADGDGQLRRTQTPTVQPSTQDPSLHEWMRFIRRLVQPFVPDGLPLTPVASSTVNPATPMSLSFTNPFATRPPESSDPVRPRPDSRHSARTAAPQPHHSTLSSVSQATYATVPVTGGRERTKVFPAANPPSLRSRRSDLSSKASSMAPQAVTMPTPHQVKQQPSAALGGFHHIDTAAVAGPRP